MHKMRIYPKAAKITFVFWVQPKVYVVSPSKHVEPLRQSKDPVHSLVFVCSLKIAATPLILPIITKRMG